MHVQLRDKWSSPPHPTAQLNELTSPKPLPWRPWVGAQGPHFCHLGGRQLRWQLLPPLTMLRAASPSLSAPLHDMKHSVEMVYSPSPHLAVISAYVLSTLPCAQHRTIVQ